MKGFAFRTFLYVKNTLQKGCYRKQKKKKATKKNEKKVNVMISVRFPFLIPRYYFYSGEFVYAAPRLIINSSRAAGLPVFLVCEVLLKTLMIWPTPGQFEIFFCW